MKEYLASKSEVLSQQNVTEYGLTGQEAKARLEQYGPNKLAEGRKVTVIERFLKELTDPMIIILIVAAIISGVTAVYSGESFADVVIIMAVVIINAVLGVVQESKAEKAIAALQEIADTLVYMAENLGGRDNITVVLARVEKEEKAHG